MLKFITASSLYNFPVRHFYVRASEKGSKISPVKYFSEI